MSRDESTVVNSHGTPPLSPAFSRRQLPLHPHSAMPRPYPLLDITPEGEVKPPSSLV